MAASQESLETFYTLCGKLAENFEKMRNSQDYYRMDSMIRNSNDIEDFVEKILCRTWRKMLFFYLHVMASPERGYESQ